MDQTFSHLAPLLVILVQALGIAAAAEAVMRARTAQGSIAWALGLVLFPYVSLPLYWAFGRFKFDDYAVALRELRHRNRTALRGIQEALLSLRAPLPPEREGDFGVLEKIGWLPFLSGNRAELLVDGAATFESIFAAVDAAREYILVSFYIINDDHIGRDFKARLSAKAAKGVRVYLLYDEIGSHALSGSYLQELSDAGIEVRSFHTARSFFARFRINFRNHRKVVVADGRVGFIGGINVGDEYLGRDRRYGPWRDTHLRLEGPAVTALQLAFAADWHWATGEETPPLFWACPRAEGADTSVLVLATGPGDVHESCLLFVMQLIASAQRRLWIASPYFVPDSAVMEALKLAAYRGVDVRIMLPKKPDHLLIHLAAYSFLPEAEEAGIAVYRYQPGFMHQKVMLVDDDAAVVGTVNLDNRSLRLNFEISAVMSDRDMATRVAAMLEEDFGRCRRAASEDFLARRLPFRIASRVARLFSPIL